MATSFETEHKLLESGCRCRVANLKSSLGVVITHPWGVLGGDMDNTIVRGMASWFQKLGITTIRFNFGGSQLGRGHAQVNQVKEAAKFLLDGTHLLGSDDDVRPTYILLVGYSYGSIICGSASATIDNCIGVVSIAPPFGVRHWLYCFNGNYHLGQAQIKPSLQKLFIIGSVDNFTSEKAFTEVIQSFPAESTTGAVLKKADHFFQGRKKDLQDIIGHWILTTYPQCCGHLHQLAKTEFMIANQQTDSENPNVGYGCNLFDK